MEERSNDPKVWLKWLEDENTDGEDIISDDNLDLSDAETVVDDDVNDEQVVENLSDDDESEEEYAEDFYLGKDKKTAWKKNPARPNVKIPSRNIISRLPGPKGIAKTATSEIDCINLILDDNVIMLIVKYTNIYITSIKEKFLRDRDARLTDNVEIRALFGILYLIGMMKMCKVNTNKIWNNEKGNGIERCYLAMSGKRFHFLLRCIRYDDITTRSRRCALDKLAPIREVMDVFLKNFQNFYTPGEYLTVDEQLVAFRGRCSFRQYIPSKPARYGIKIFALVDCRMMYTVNLEVYCGKQPIVPFEVSNAGKDVVMRIAQPILGTGRNITGDNWFSSLPLVDELVKKKTTYVGTLRHNKAEIPGEFLPNKSRNVNTSIFGFRPEVTLVSYCERKSKAVMLLSSMHSDNAIDESTGSKNKPEIVSFYNKTKIGVDVLDQLCSNYNVARTTNRWPNVIFFDLLNIAAINALCIYSANHNYKKTNRADFLDTISWHLIKPQIEARMKLSMIPSSLKIRGNLLLGENQAEREPPKEKKDGKGRCKLCGRAKNRSTRKSCQKCEEWVCGEHSETVVMCQKCK